MTINIEVPAQATLADVLAAARQDGEVRIKIDSGEEFVVRPAVRELAPKDLPTVRLNVTRDEIVQAVRESRERDYTPR